MSTHTQTPARNKKSKNQIWRLKMARLWWENIGRVLGSSDRTLAAGESISRIGELKLVIYITLSHPGL